MAGLHYGEWGGIGFRSTRLVGGGIEFGAPNQSRVPYIAVGYKGYSTLEALKKRLSETPQHQRPDGALVIESGVFVAPSCQATGALGLYGLAVEVMRLVRIVTSAEANIGEYVAAHVEPFKSA